MKKDSKNHVVITQDGWVYVLKRHGESFGLGDIDVDVAITDLRTNKRHRVNKDLVTSLKKNGMTVKAIALELGVSRPTVYKLLESK